MRTTRAAIKPSPGRRSN